MTQTVPSVVNTMVTQSKPGHFILQGGPSQYMHSEVCSVLEYDTGPENGKN